MQHSVPGEAVLLMDLISWLSPQGVPEDLLLFYESLRKGGGVSRVDECLLMYRYHSQAATHSVLE